jgi:multiple sugar transport system permease protein
MRNRQELWTGLLFVSPWLVGCGVFLVYPILCSLYYSFCFFNTIEDASYWVGLENYQQLSRDKVFWTSLQNTFYYALFTIPIGLSLALLLALLLNFRLRGLAFYRAIFFLPALLPLVAVTMLWLWIFHGQYGLFNSVLRWFDLPGPAWLSDPRWAMPALILMSFWSAGYAMVVFLAGLQEVPQHLYEAARIDGASVWQQIRHVAIPYVRPVIYFNVVMGIIGVLQVFAIPYIMTNGGPGRATTFLALYIYQTAFEDYRMGYASAMAWVLFLLILVLTLAANHFAGRKVQYGEN